MFGQGGRGKKRTELERLLRQDHSNVYFDNERLNDQLNLRIDEMQKEMHRHDIQRGVEIGKLRQEIREFKAKQVSNQEEKDDKEETAPRPHTSVGHSSRKRTATARPKQRAKSAWARTQTKDTDVTENGNLEDTQEEKGEDGEPERERSQSPASSVSTLRNTKTLRKYRTIGANSFKENNRFPEEWYIKCLPASDAAIHNARKKVRGKFVTPNFSFLGKLREKEEMEKKLEAYNKINTKLLDNRNNDNASDGEAVEGMTLICEEPVKPVLMSRRRLMEISNVENLVERGPSRNTVRKQNIKDLNALDTKRIDDRVKDFCREIEKVKAREMEAMKEREEARMQEALERIQIEAIEAAKVRKEPEEKQKNEDDYDDKFKHLWK